MSEKIERIKIGEVGVDSGQLMICDPCYIDITWKKETRTNTADHAHEIYRHTETGTLWQFTYDKPPQEGVNMIPGNYSKIIPQFGKSANDLRESGEFEKTDMDPRPHITPDEFSYRGVCKAMMNDNYASIQDGVAAVFSSGFGDGRYAVYAEIADYDGWGKRVKRVTIELITDEEDDDEA